MYLADCQRLAVEESAASYLSIECPNGRVEDPSDPPA
jgi:hypothetical protein